jgi:hypothetical protein
MNKRIWWNGGCAALVFFTLAATVPAQTFTTLVNFNGPNGWGPEYMTLVQGVGGDFYGTTKYGGA